MQDEFVWLNIPFHKNKVSFDISEDDELKDTLKISFDGSIMAVKKSCISSFYAEQKVAMIRAGYQSFPKRERGYVIDSKEELYKTLAYWVEI